MLLVVDVGNTQTHFGTFVGTELVEHWRFATVRTSTADELGAALRSLLGLRGLGFGDLDASIVSSTVPQLEPEWRWMAERYLGHEMLAVGPGVRTGMAIRYDNRNVPAHLMLGDAYRLLDRGADARKELEWVIATDPTQVGARYNLGLLFLMSSKLPGLTDLQATNKAIEQLEAYKAKAPRGGPDDVDELLVRAKSRKALLEAAQAEKKGGA